MKEFFKKIRADYIFSSLLTIALGIVFIIWKTDVVQTMGMIFAILLIGLGVLYVGCFLLKVFSNVISGLLGVIVLGLGIWFFFKPNIIMEIIPFLLGAMFIFHGVRGMIESASAKKYGYKGWGIGMGLSTAGIVVGIISIIKAYKITEFTIVVIGIILVLTGLSNIGIAIRSARTERVYRKQETIDSQFVEDNGKETIEGSFNETDGV